MEGVVGTTEACRGCGAPDLVAVLSLGRTPLANALLPPDAGDRPEPVYPLDVVRCPACTLVQLTVSVPPEAMFREYAYFSSVSDALVAHAGALATRLVRERGLGPASRAVEVASNDGYLLQHYRAAGVPVLGIEPAANVAEVARAKGVDTVEEFFGLDLARRLRAAGTAADVLHAHNVLAHVPDLKGVVAGFRVLLADTGLLVVEVPYLIDLVDHCEFDTIYHEHLCYFSLTALDDLLRRADLAIVDVERLAIHGGSLRLFAAPAGRAPAPAAAVSRLLDAERAWGVGRDEPYAAFRERVARIGNDLRGLVARLHAEGRRVAAYGASAKGATLLNYTGLDRSDIEFVADRSPYKQGRLMPGARIPIVPAAALAERAPDYTLLLTWNFADEILAQQDAYRRAGGRFIVPVPEVRVV